MAQDPANIHIGAARIFIGVTPPATGNPPTWLEHVDGVPGEGVDEAFVANGVEVGYTQDAATFTYKQVKQEVVAEQSLNPVDVFVTNEELQIDFTAMEHVYETLRLAFDNVGSVNDAERMAFYGGDGGGLVSVGTQCVALTSRIRTAPSHHEVLCIYRVYNMEGVSIPYNRTGEAVYKVTLKALTDTSRDVGDRLFQWFREKAVLATGATAGSPGTFTPPGSDIPLNLTAMAPVVANPLTAWTAGQHMVLGDASQAYWNATAWVAGAATFAARTGNGGKNGGGGAAPPAGPARDTERR
jgi:hypothetical protein